MTTSQPALTPAGIGAVSLRVKNVRRSSAFYSGVLGLEPLGSGAFAAPGGHEPLVRLIEAPAAAPRPARALGLFHFALLVPDRPALARVFRRLNESRPHLQGASDHEVSEALYLADPDGHGIEIYRDRPRSDWRYVDGRLVMSTLALDVDDLLSEASEAAGLPEGTRMGHIHLHVSNLGVSEEFYAGALGFDVSVRGYSGALFLSAGGYHHHVGLNTWAGPHAVPPNDQTVGMIEFEVIVPEAAAAERRMIDPDGIAIVIRGDQIREL